MFQFPVQNTVLANLNFRLSEREAGFYTTRFGRSDPAVAAHSKAIRAAAAAAAAPAAAASNVGYSVEGEIKSSHEVFLYYIRRGHLTKKETKKVGNFLHFPTF